MPNFEISNIGKYQIMKISNIMTDDQDSRIFEQCHMIEISNIRKCYINKISSIELTDRRKPKKILDAESSIFLLCTS